MEGANSFGGLILAPSCKEAGGKKTRHAFKKFRIIAECYNCHLLVFLWVRGILSLSHLSPYVAFSNLFNFMSTSSLTIQCQSCQTSGLVYSLDNNEIASKQLLCTSQVSAARRSFPSVSLALDRTARVGTPTSAYLSLCEEMNNAIGSDASRPTALCCSSKAVCFVLHSNSGEFSDETVPDLLIMYLWATEIESLKIYWGKIKANHMGRYIKGSKNSAC